MNPHIRFKELEISFKNIEHFNVHILLVFTTYLVLNFKLTAIPNPMSQNVKVIRLDMCRISPFANPITCKFYWPIYWYHIIMSYWLMHPKEQLFSEWIEFLLLYLWKYNDTTGTRYIIPLAVLDRNIDRKHITEKAYVRKFPKQIKKWDAAPVMNNKEYKYIPQLLEEIVRQTSVADSGTKHKRLLSSNHTVRIRSSIGNTYVS